MTNPLPLAGRRILLPQREASEFARAIAAAGARVDEVTLIGRVPVASAELDAFVARAMAGGFHWLAITSAYTVEALASLGHPLPGLTAGGTRVAVVGPATALAVRAAGVRVDLVPSTGSGGAALVACWPDGMGEVGIPGAVDSAQALPIGLRGRGWTVTTAGVYRTEPVSAVPADVALRWRQGDYDALVATSGSVARAAAVLLGTSTPVVALGEASATAARNAGFAPVVVSASASALSVISALVTLVG